MVYYHDETKTKMIRGTFITSNCHQQASQKTLDSTYLIVQLLRTEDAIELFCKQNSIAYTSKISMIIEAYNFLRAKIDTPTNSLTPTHMVSNAPVMSSTSSGNVDIKAEVEQVIEEIEFDEDEDDFFMDNKPPIHEQNNTLSEPEKMAWSEVFDNSLAPSTSKIVPDQNSGKPNSDVSEVLAEIVTYDVSDDLKSESNFKCSKCQKALEEPPVSLPVYQTVLRWASSTRTIMLMVSL